MEWLRAEALRQTKLTFDDLVNQFNAAQNTPCVEEALETKHWSHAAFYPPVILFDDVVQWGQFRMESAKKSGVRISKAEVSLRPYPSSHSFCELFYKAWADGRQHRTPDFLALSRDCHRSKVPVWDVHGNPVNSL
jgi:hypothetical protein